MFRTIVLAIDGSESSDRAVDIAGKLATELSSRIIAVHVVEHMGGRAGAVPVHADEGSIQGKINSQIESLKKSGLDASIQFAEGILGGPAHVIAEVASTERADVIITGTRGHSQLTGLVVGSVAQRLIHLAPCPVLVVRDGDS
jgi:nucleotide-binding universal stress UspA family protein